MCCERQPVGPFAMEEDLAPSLPLHADVLTAMSEADLDDGRGKIRDKKVLQGQ